MEARISVCEDCMLKIANNKSLLEESVISSVFLERVDTTKMVGMAWNSRRVTIVLGRERHDNIVKLVNCTISARRYH